MPRVLVVDDDPMVLSDNKAYLGGMGYEVICADTAQKAWEILTGMALDCIVLDIDLPDGDGFSLCERARERTGVPIVFLSGYTEEHSRIRGLELGGDDYICKPYSLHELELRVRARIRAGHGAYPPQPVSYGELVIDPACRVVSYGVDTVALSTYEFDLLYFLARHPGQVFTHEQIFDQVWQAPMNSGIKSLQMIVVRLRQKLSELCPAHEYIQTVRRKGYFFAPLA